MISLYGFGRVFGLPDASPFVVKTLIHLKMANIDYGFEDGFKYYRQAPRGKLPYIHDDGQIIADSHLIRRHIETKLGLDLDVLVESERLVSLSLLELCFENHFYWISVYNRWMVEDNWQAFKQEAFLKAPAFLQPIIPFLARKKVESNLHNHGIGRHDEVEIFRQGANDISLCSQILGEHKFFGIDHPCGREAFVFASLLSLRNSPANSLLKRALMEKSNLLDYIDRMHTRFFG